MQGHLPLAALLVPAVRRGATADGVGGLAVVVIVIAAAAAVVAGCHGLLVQPDLQLDLLQLLPHVAGAGAVRGAGRARVAAAGARSRAGTVCLWAVQRRRACSDLTTPDPKQVPERTKLRRS
eukprot:scaffold114515_cov18-Tisochrysis_lutea.AAC.1